MAERNHTGQSLVRREKPSHDSWGCATRGSVEKQEGARERHPECGSATADDGGGETRSLEFGHADEGNDTSGKHAHPSPSGGSSNDDPSWCPKSQGAQSDTDACRSRRAAQPKLRSSAGFRHRGAGKASHVEQFSSRITAGNRCRLLHIPGATCSCTEYGGSDHGECNHRGGIHGCANTPTGS